MGNNAGVVELTRLDHVLLKLAAGMPPISGATKVLELVFMFAVACKAYEAMP